MKHFSHRCKGAVPALLAGMLLLTACGCAANKFATEKLPPVLTQDELLRPYHKVAVITVRRERYGSPSDVTPDDYSWAYHALQEEAARIGADAVILPEIKVDLENYIVFPTSEMKANGVAIKFE